ncbi:MAG TPA: hypothetical protein VF447_00095 [Terriglobales bacterium]
MTSPKAVNSGQTEREAFEAWCTSEGIDADKSKATGVYSYPSARVAWRAWQARAASTATALAEQSAAPMADEPRNVEGMTRAEFQDHLRVCLQHDNVRRHERGIPQMTQDEMDSEIRERVERSYPSSAYDYSPRCPGCAAFDSDASEVHFVQGCEGCKARMQKIAGFGPLTADPLPRPSEQADEAVTDGVAHFNWLCSLMPEGFHWGEPLTPDVLSHIASAARAKEPK